MIVVFPNDLKTEIQKVEFLEKQVGKGQLSNYLVNYSADGSKAKLTKLTKSKKTN